MRFTRQQFIGSALLLCVGVLLIIVFDMRREPTHIIETTPESAEVVEVPSVSISTSTVSIIGTSTNGLPIYSYTFGTGATDILFVGGIHGGYEWNSIALAYEVIDAFIDGTLEAPTNQTIHIIPSLNPDGAKQVVGSGERFNVSEVERVPVGTGRFNANNVDLNRNFDCRWQPTSTWRGQPVSAGEAPFSEVEARVLRDYIFEVNPVGVVMWHSQANAVYGSECGAGVLATTTRMLSTYATAAEYTPIAVFDAYPISGDVEGWLASIGIPAITVELETRTDTDWERNQNGINALLQLW